MQRLHRCRAHIGRSLALLSAALDAIGRNRRRRSVGRAGGVWDGDAEARG